MFGVEEVIGICRLLRWQFVTDMCVYVCVCVCVYLCVNFKKVYAIYMSDLTLSLILPRSRTGTR